VGEGGQVLGCGRLLEEGGRDLIDLEGGGGGKGGCGRMISLFGNRPFACGLSPFPSSFSFSPSPFSSSSSFRHSLPPPPHLPIRGLGGKDDGDKEGVIVVVIQRDGRTRVEIV
jgi:hypothetical protein